MVSSFDKPPTMEKISEALKSIPTKKAELHRAFQVLQSHYTSAFSSSHLQWSDIDSRISSIQFSLETQFQQLQSNQPPPEQQHEALAQPLKKPELDLKSMCIKMKAFALSEFVKDKDRSPTNSEEVKEAVRLAPDPAKLVLDALHLLYYLSARKTTLKVENTILWLLQGVLGIGNEIKPETKEGAKKLAFAWMKKLSPELFMQFLSTYGLKNEFSVDDLVQIVVSVASMGHAYDLCRVMGLESRVPDIIEMLISKKNPLDALRFAHAFELFGKFPPAPLLEAYMKESKQTIQEFLDKENNSYAAQHKARDRKILYLQKAFKCIKDYNLEFAFSLETLDMQIKELKKKDLKLMKKMAMKRQLTKELRKKAAIKRQSTMRF